MICEEEFWQTEGGAPLLNENGGFLKSGGPNDDALSRASKWLELAGVDMEKALTLPKSDEPLRIYLADAERTFMSDAYRKRLVVILQGIGDYVGDYHQGLGYTASFLSLYLGKDNLLRLLVHLWETDKFIPGYWRGAPDAFVRDAMVYERLAQRFFPEVAAHLRGACVVPEAYTQKWFVGLCIQVLPYAALFDFFDAFFEIGYRFLFQFAMAVLARLSPQILALAKNQVNDMFALLRLDKKVSPSIHEEAEWYVELVAAARAFDLEDVDLPALRAEEWDTLQKKQAAVREKEAKMKAEESDDEIVFSDEEEDA